MLFALSLACLDKSFDLVRSACYLTAAKRISERVGGHLARHHYCRLQCSGLTDVASLFRLWRTTSEKPKKLHEEEEEEEKF